MEELDPLISQKISEGTQAEILAAKIDLDYAYGQVERRKNKERLHITAVYRILPFAEGILRTRKHANNFSNTYRHYTLEHKHTAWLDDILLVTEET